MGTNILIQILEREILMEKNIVFNQADFFYTLAGASVLTGILVFFTHI
jgi:hypothetical protein